MIEDFVYTAPPSRVSFGTAAVDALPVATAELDLQRVLVIAAPSMTHVARTATRTLGGTVADVWDRTVMHVPRELAADASARARELGIDGLIAIGGGSAIGLAKAVALEQPLSIIAVPSTYAGSEMTPVWGVTADGVKHTGTDARVLPRSVVYDPELTRSLPAPAAAASGINALAHAVEAVYAPDASPVVSLMAKESVSALACALPALVDAPEDPKPRRDALYGAWLAGACLGSTTMSLHHKLCHVLGGYADLPHAQTHTSVLPHVMAHNLQAAPRASALLGDALGTDDPARAVFASAAQMGVYVGLEELGLPRHAIDVVVAQLLDDDRYPNPAPIDEAGLRELLERAHRGVAPAPATR